MMDEPGKENMTKARELKDKATGVILTLDGGMVMKG